MSLGAVPSAIYIQNKSASLSSTRILSSVTVFPVAIFSILDHYLRRSDAQVRVIGTLLGTRSEAEVEIRSSFAVLHSETSEQVAVDMEYHRTMYELYHKINPKEVIVGWYSTGSNLNTYSALIQNFYSQETAPFQAIHLAVSMGLEASEPAGVKAFTSSPVGIYPKPENCVFVPVPVEIRLHEAERNVDVDFVTRTVAAPSSQPIADLDILQRSILIILDMIDQALAYVHSVLSGEKKGDPSIGRFLMDTLGVSAGDLDKTGFNASLQDTLMISYLANLVRSQTELASRLALVASL